MHAVELAGLSAAVAEARELLQRLPIDDATTLSFMPSAMKMYFCCGSFENAMSHTAPEPFVFFAKNASLTNLPSGVKTCRRSPTRSHT